MKAVIIMEIPTQEVEERFNQLADSGEQLVLMTGYSNYEDFYNDEVTTDLMEYVKGTSYNIVIETSNYYVITPSLDFGADNSGTRALARILKKLGAMSPVMESQIKNPLTKNVKVTKETFTFENSHK